MTDRKIDWSQVTEFLSFFDHKIFTFQLLKNGKPAGYYTTVNNIPYEELTKAHNQGKEIFLMVNEGDGIIHPNRQIPRSKENVIALDSLFIDTDEVPLSEVKAFLKPLQIKPHLIVETSPGRYHLYIFLDKIRREGMAPEEWRRQLHLWRELQLTLAHLGKDQPQTDRSMSDESRVLRVPGFYHLKNPEKPFPCRIRKVYDDPRPTLQEMQSLLLPGRSVQGMTFQVPRQPDPYQLPDTKVTPGNRHAEMLRFLGAKYVPGIDREVLKSALYDQLIRPYFTESDQFEPNKPRHHEVENALQYIFDEREREEQQIRIEACEHAISHAVESDPFELPEQFYLQAPGLLGQITREIESTAHYRLPEASFCGALSLLACCKGASYRLQEPYPFPPSLYLCCLAPTGSGKNNAKSFLRNAATVLGIQDRVVGGVRGGIGVLLDIQNAAEQPTFVLDESAKLLQALTDPRAESYEKSALNMFLQLFSAYNDPVVNFGSRSDSRGSSNITLNRPHINVFAFGVNTLIRRAFSIDSVDTGFLQRFIVVSTTRPRIENPHKQPLDLSQELEGSLKQLIIDFDDTTQKVHKFENAAVRNRFVDFKREMDERVNLENKHGSGLAGIFTRAAEQVGRVVCAGAEDKVSSTLMDFAIEFISSRTEALTAICQEEFNKPTHAKELDELERFILQNVNSEGWCTYRKIIRSFKVRDTDQLKKLLHLGVEANRLEVNYKYRKGDSKGRVGIAYTVNIDDLSR